MRNATQVLEPETAVGFKRILLATDFSDISRRAMGYAAELARQYGSELFVVHVLPAVREAIPMEPLPREMNPPLVGAEERMKALGESIPDIEHHLLVEQGPAAQVLSRLVQDEDIDLLVVGTHGRSGVKKLALGSVAEEVSRRVDCPVLTVGCKTPCPAHTEPTFHRILFATDFGAGAVRAVPLVAGLAERYGSRLILLHMVTPLPMVDSGVAAYGSYGVPGYLSEDAAKWEEDRKRESVSKLLQTLPTGTKLAHEPEYVVGAERAPEGILLAAATRNVDLIVMGVHRTASPGAVARLPWAVAHHVISKAKCPVLTVRS